MTVKKDIRCSQCNADASKVIEFYKDGDWGIIDIISLQKKLEAIRKLMDEKQYMDEAILLKINVLEVLDS